MEADWQSGPLGDFLTLQRGFDLPSQDRRPGTIPIVSSSGISGVHSEAMVAGPGVVTGRYGTVGQVFLIRQDFWPLNTTLWVKDFKGNDPRFAYYLLQTIDYNSCSDKSSVPGVNRNDLHRLQVVTPGQIEQRAIAHVLGTLDDKIELNRRMNETLEAIARAIFKSWFVDFDPVRAKAEGRDLGLPKHIADLFPDDFEETPDGIVPQGWKLGTVADLSRLNAETWSKRTRPPVVRYVDLSNTKWGRIESVVSYAEAEAPSRAQRVLRPLDSIVGTVRPGNGSFAFITEDGLTGSTAFAVLRPLRREYAEFVYLAATASTNIESLQHLADGGAYPAVRPEVVAASAVVRPSEPVLEAFSRLCKPLFDQIASNHRECATLAEIRDALLPKLLSGEIRIHNTKSVAARAG